MSRLYRSSLIIGLFGLFLWDSTATALSVDPVPDSLRAHNIFQSNMVIQRDKPVDVWGWSKPGDKVTVSFAGKTAEGVAGKDGKWKATLPSLTANSEPGTMTIKSKEGSITLENVLVGDVWILGGQSNMAWGIGGTENGNLEVASANFPNIRMLTVPKIYGPQLKEDFPRAAEFSKISGKEGDTTGDWQICSPETVGSMSAIGYVMGRRVHMAAQVPIALINTSRGGSTVQAWTPISRMRKLSDPDVKRMIAESDEKIAAYDPHENLKKQIAKFENKVAQMKKEGKKIPANMKPPTELDPGPLYTHKVPGNCYSSIISPIAGFAAKGVLWHQGYNNCFQGVHGAQMYRAVFPEMIAAWREAFRDEALPFCILSQCTAGKMQSRDDFLPKLLDIGARIREAQYQTYLELLDAGDQNIGFVSTYDLRHQSYHPRVKIPAGERAAAWALVTQYDMGSQLIWTPPRLKEMKSVEGKLHLTFDMPGKRV